MGFREAVERNQKFQKSTSISTSNINKVSTTSTTKRPNPASQHNTDWRLRDIISFDPLPSVSADRGDNYEIPTTPDMTGYKEDPNAESYGTYEELYNSPGGYRSNTSRFSTNIAEAVKTPEQPFIIPNSPVIDQTIEEKFTPQKNTQSTEKFNTFTPTYGYQYDDVLQKEIQKQKEQHPDAFKDAGAWSNKTKPTMQITGGSQPFNQETYGKVQTQLNKQQLNREMKVITDIWQNNFLMTFGQEGAPTKAEARAWVDEQKEIIASKGNIGGYNYGGYQQMYMDDLESRFTKLYGMSNKNNKNRKLTKAEELYQIRQERDLTEKERQQLGILTGTLEKPKKKKIEYAQDGTWANPFPNKTNFGGYEQFL